MNTNFLAEVQAGDARARKLIPLYLIITLLLNRFRSYEKIDTRKIFYQCALNRIQ